VIADIDDGDVQVRAEQWRKRFFDLDGPLGCDAMKESNEYAMATPGRG